MSKNQKRVDSDYSDKIRSNAEVCTSLREFISSRAIIDPFVVSKMRPEPKGHEKEQLVRRLQESFKNMENRCHPWMSEELKSQVKEHQSNSTAADS